MARSFRRGRAPAAGRRTGPSGEVPWWDRADQAAVEAGFLTSKDWGRGWQSVEIPGNAERLDPYGDDPASEAVRSARAGRRLTALDEGAAWRRPREPVLAVVRYEVFAEPDGGGAHRAAWQAQGRACLDEVWRARWRERDRHPGWIEVRWRTGDAVGHDVALPEELDGLDQIDWLQVEDQTGTHDTGTVTRYQHLSVWTGRGLATLTVRHDLGHDLDDVVGRAAGVVGERMASLDR